MLQTRSSISFLLSNIVLKSNHINPLLSIWQKNMFLFTKSHTSIYSSFYLVAPLVFGHAHGVFLLCCWCLALIFWIGKHFLALNTLKVSIIDRLRRHDGILEHRETEAALSLYSPYSCKRWWKCGSRKKIYMRKGLCVLGWAICQTKLLIDNISVWQCLLFSPRTKMIQLMFSSLLPFGCFTSTPFRRFSWTWNLTYLCY